MKISVTGYNGSGASALYSLLKEYSNVTYIEREVYEHPVFYTPNGLFDLEYKLFLGWNLQRTDEAIHSFVTEMKRLNNYDFNWFGGLRKIHNEKFMNLVNEFIDKLVEYEFNTTWAYDYEKTQLSISRIIKDLMILASGRKIINFGKNVKYKKDTIICTVISKKKFYELAREFVDGYMSLFMKNNDENVIFDRLLTPYDAYRVPKFFPEDFRLIIVDRDPRDMYLFSKYIRPNRGAISKYPKEVKEFIKYWKATREREIITNDKRIMKIHFEELIYNYENTIRKIEDFLGFFKNAHKYKNLYFNPKIAINNTQYFNLREDWKREVAPIKEELEDYLYEYPFYFKPSLTYY